jgi:hypothetical protein
MRSNTLVASSPVLETDFSHGVAAQVGAGGDGSSTASSADALLGSAEIAGRTRCDSRARGEGSRAGRASARPGSGDVAAVGGLHRTGGDGSSSGIWPGVRRRAAISSANDIPLPDLRSLCCDGMTDMSSGSSFVRIHRTGDFSLHGCCQDIKSRGLDMSM